jgi:hypothetical protein
MFCTKNTLYEFVQTKNKNMKRLFFYILLLASVITYGQANNRYPNRLPDWIWRDQIRSVFFDEMTIRELDSKIINMNHYTELKDYIHANALSNEINYAINSRLALIDIAKDAQIITSSNNELNLAIKLDPEFTEDAKKVIAQAAKIFLDVALNDDVIEESMKHSTSSPQPIPKMFDTKAINNKSAQEYTPEYIEYNECRTKPISSAQFKTQMKYALTTPIGDPALIIISSYKGSSWWGGATYNYYYNTMQQLSRFSPSQGYLYMRLNTDSLKTNTEPEFWASKLAQYVLYNIGYWHPIFANTAERDKYNFGDNYAFVYAYENAVLKRARLSKK